jgi:small conductance mechanosensitive channel
MLQTFQKRLAGKLQRDGGATALEALKRAETLTALLRQGSVFGIGGLGALVVLSELGFEIGPILASASVLGLGLGFGAQALVRDVIAGFFLVLENQVRVGDVAGVNGVKGLVESINFRTLVLRDMAGVVHVFPNGSINTLANLTKDWSAYVFDISVAYREDTDRIVNIMQLIGDELRADPVFGPVILGDIEIFGVDRLANVSVIIKARIKTLPIRQWEVGREYLRRLKKAFEASGVELPLADRFLVSDPIRVPPANNNPATTEQIFTQHF